MIVEEQKLERKPAADLGRRDVLALAGAAAAVGLAAGPALAQSQPATAATQPPTKPTVVLDRPVKGVLLIGIDRIDAQNRIDIPTFSAIGQAYFQFEHDDDLKVAVLHGKGPDFSQGLDQASWGSCSSQRTVPDTAKFHRSGCDRGSRALQATRRRCARACDARGARTVPRRGSAHRGAGRDL